MDTLELEINNLKSSMLEMWHVVIRQLDTARMALNPGNPDLADEVHITEKLLDSFELKHDEACQNILSVHHPRESNFRFVLASLRINSNLERIGDYANSIANFIRKSEEPFNALLLKEIQIDQMFEIAHVMLVRLFDSYNSNNVKHLRNISELDKKLDGLQKDSIQVLNNYILQNKSEAVSALLLFSFINKLERVGDHNMNISEEIVYFLENKIIKHKKVHNQ